MTRWGASALPQHLCTAPVPQAAPEGGEGHQLLPCLRVQGPGVHHVHRLAVGHQQRRPVVRQQRLQRTQEARALALALCGIGAASSRGSKCVCGGGGVGS